MSKTVRLSPEIHATSWISAFSRCMASEDASALSRMFEADSHWRNLCGLSWQMATVSGSQRLSDELCRCAREAGATAFEIHPEMLSPRTVVVAGREVIVAVFRFNTANGPGLGVVRIVPTSDDGALSEAWTISTLLDMEKISRAKSQTLVSNARDFGGPDWLEQRRAEIDFGDREPDVLVVW